VPCTAVATAVAALDKSVPKHRRQGVTVQLIERDQASATLVERLGIHDKPGADIHSLGG
jgi:SulP family sulfate permease